MNNVLLERSIFEEFREWGEFRILHYPVRGSDSFILQMRRTKTQPWKEFLVFLVVNGKLTYRLAGTENATDYKPDIVSQTPRTNES